VNRVVKDDHGVPAEEVADVLKDLVIDVYVMLFGLLATVVHNLFVEERFHIVVLGFVELRVRDVVVA